MKFEYDIVELHDREYYESKKEAYKYLLKDLNAKGEDGWEVIHHCHNGDSLVKRRIDDNHEELLKTIKDIGRNIVNVIAGLRR